MTPEQREALVDGIKSTLDERDRELQSRLLMLEQKSAAAGDAHLGTFSRGYNPFAAEAFKSRLNLVKEGQPTTGRILLPGVRLKGLKALVNGPDSDSPSSGVSGQAQRGPMVGPVMRPMTLIDALTSIPVSSNKYEYLRITRTSNAAVQENEGDQKAQSTFESALMTADIATIAHWTDASKQVLADNPQLFTLLRNILAIDAVDEFERQLLLGDGLNGNILGLIPQATILAVNEPLASDAISQGLAMMFAGGFVASAVALHPTTWHNIRTQKGNGDGQYLVGSWAVPAAPNIWNTPIVQNSAVPAGFALLLDETRIRVLDREQVSVLVSAEDRDNFVKNLLTVLAELRGGLAVLDTGGVGYVELPVGSST